MSDKVVKRATIVVDIVVDLDFDKNDLAVAEWNTATFRNFSGSKRMSVLNYRSITWESDPAGKNAIEPAEPPAARDSDAFKKDALRVMGHIAEDARMALDDKWDRGDDGFHAQLDLLDEFCRTHAATLIEV